MGWLILMNLTDIVPDPIDLATYIGEARGHGTYRDERRTTLQRVAGVSRASDVAGVGGGARGRHQQFAAFLGSVEGVDRLRCHRHRRAPAGALAAHGVKRGDHVALLCTNRIEFMEIVLGCGWLGAVVVPINTASRGLQLEHILRNSGARLLVAEAHLVDVIHALDVQDLPLERIWLIDEPAAPTRAEPAYATIPLPPAGEPIAAAALADEPSRGSLHVRDIRGCRRA